MRRIAIWYYLLNKRLLKKCSFLLILCMVPFLVGAMRLASGGESGVMRIALVLRNPEDELSSQIVEQLTEEKGVLQYIRCNTEEEARRLVTEFEADAAWIFPENLEGALMEAAWDKTIKPAVLVVEREDSVPLAFTREILSKTMYPCFSYGVYESFVRDDLGISDVGDEELKAAYNRTLTEGNFFQMEYPDGQADEGIDYLMAPVRGMLAVWLLLCGFVASMYYMQDEQQGTFQRMPVNQRLWVAFGMHGVLLSDAMVILLTACKTAGVFTLWYRELASLFLYACCITTLCNLIRLLCRTPERLGSCIPVILMASLVLCPVFVSFKGLRTIKYLLPTDYYLKSIHSPHYLYQMAVYAAAAAVLCALIYRQQNQYNK